VIPYIDLKVVNTRFRDQLIADFTRVLDSGWYIRGAECEAFEAELARYVGVRSCVGVGNGLDALTLVLRAWKEQGKLRDGDEVIVPANTYIATILAITENQLTPVLVEPVESTFNLDPGRIEQAITTRTRVILPVHLYGRAADMPAIVDIARRHRALVLEDAAQAHGAAIQGRRIGSWGDAAAFSFYPGKNLGALGDGGAVTSDDEGLVALVRTLGDYGSKTKYVNELQGTNSRLDELQAALLRTKLQFLDSDNRARRGIAATYLENIASTAIRLPSSPIDADEHVWHIFPIRCVNRDRVRELLRAEGVATLVHYPIPPHRQRAFGDRFAGQSFALTECIHDEVLSLPMSPALTVQDAEQISRIVSQIQVDR
jgi:dTDP-4-amino-4,6-dideoxygalactose transaminase